MKRAAVPATSPDEPITSDPILANEDEDEDEVQDEESAWRGSRQTRKRIGDLKVLASTLVRGIVIKAQTSVDQELAFMAGRVAQIDATIVAFGGESILKDRK